MSHWADSRGVKLAPLCAQQLPGRFLSTQKVTESQVLSLFWKLNHAQVSIQSLKVSTNTSARLSPAWFNEQYFLKVPPLRNRDLYTVPLEAGQSVVALAVAAAADCIVVVVEEEGLRCIISFQARLYHVQLFSKSKQSSENQSTLMWRSWPSSGFL